MIEVEAESWTWMKELRDQAAVDLLPLLATICLSFPAVGCDNNDPFDNPASRIRGGSNQAAAALPSLADPRGCAKNPVDTLALVKVAELLPADHPDARADSSAESEPWLPGHIADLTALEHGYAVVDRVAAEVAWLGSELTPRVRRGRRGDGPAEFQQPVAVAVVPTGDTVWVLDRRLRVAKAFSPAGSYVSSRQLHAIHDDIAASGNGIILATTNQLPFRFSLGEVASTDVLIAYSTEARETLFSITRDSLKFPKFNLHGVTLARVATGGRTTVLYYPASGAMSFIHGYQRHDHRVCVPESIDEAYREQYARTEQTIGGQIIETQAIMISDVLVSDMDTIYALNPARTDAGFFVVERFSPFGEAYGSILLMGHPQSVNHRSYFGDRRATSIVTISQGEVLTKYKMERR